MKKSICIYIIIIILLSVVPAVNAATSITVSKSIVNPGEIVTISGVTDAAQYISVRITDGFGNIIYFGGAEADGSGNYLVSYTVPADISAGALRVTAGSGNDTASADITVVVPEPTPYKAVNPRTGMSNTNTVNYTWLIVFIVVLFTAAVTGIIIKRKKIFS